MNPESHITKQSQQESDGDWEDVMYWCHNCRERFERRGDDDDEIKCPQCESEFVEEIEDGNNPDDFHAEVGSESSDESEQHQPHFHMFGMPGTGGNTTGGDQINPFEMLNTLFGGLNRQAGHGNENGGPVNPMAGLMGMLNNIVGSNGVPVMLPPITFNLGQGGQGGQGGFVNMGDYTFGDLDALIARLTDMGRIGTPPTSDKVLKDLPHVNLTAADLEHCHDGCTICQEEFALDEEALKLPCGHFFHDACVRPWLQEHCTCPTCRWELTTDDKDWEAQKHDRNQRMAQ